MLHLNITFAELWKVLRTSKDSSKLHVKVSLCNLTNQYWQNQVDRQSALPGCYWPTVRAISNYVELWMYPIQLGRARPWLAPQQLPSAHSRQTFSSFVMGQLQKISVVVAKVLLVLSYLIPQSNKERPSGKKVNTYARVFHYSNQSKLVFVVCLQFRLIKGLSGKKNL